MVQSAHRGTLLPLIKEGDTHTRWRTRHGHSVACVSRPVCRTRHGGPCGGAIQREPGVPARDSNIPGKSLIAVVVSYPPGAKSASHHHAGSAFIYAYVLTGSVRSQVDDEPIKVYRTGESWYEAPGAHHKVSENASATEPAQLLAVFVVDSDDRVLTVPDKQ